MPTTYSISIFLLSFLVLSQNSCTTPTVTFKTDSPAKLSLSAGNELEANETPLGETPLTLELNKLKGGVVKVTSKGKSPLYWAFSDALGDTTQFTLKLPNELNSSEETAEDPRTTTAPQKAKKNPGNNGATSGGNRLMRLILRSYQALVSQNYQVARELADQASTLDPTLAAPHLIRGLSFHQEGKKDEAESALIRAKTLDPEDTDIDTLISRIRS